MGEGEQQAVHHTLAPVTLAHPLWPPSHPHPPPPLNIFPLHQRHKEQHTSRCNDATTTPHLSLLSCSTPPTGRPSLLHAHVAQTHSPAAAVWPRSPHT